MTVHEETNPPTASGERVPPVRGRAGAAAVTAGDGTDADRPAHPIGESLGASVGAVGLMVTAQGVAAGLGAPFIVAWSRRVDRRRLLTALLVVLVIGNLITSIARTTR